MGRGSWDCIGHEACPAFGHTMAWEPDCTVLSEIVRLNPISLDARDLCLGCPQAVCRAQVGPSQPGEG